MSSPTTADLSSALEILIHPLVVMSIADHHTRKAVEQPPPSPLSSRVFGLLFGEQAGVSVNVLETVEMAYTRDAQGKIQLQQIALEADMKLCQPSSHPPAPPSGLLHSSPDTASPLCSAATCECSLFVLSVV